MPKTFLGCNLEDCLRNCCLLKCLQPGSEYRDQGIGIRVSGSGYRDQGIGIRVSRSGYRDQGIGVRVSGSRIPLY